MSIPQQQALNGFFAQWYNSLTSALPFDAGNFQLVQGSDPLGNLSEQLWTYFDSIPPVSLSQFYNPAQISSFASIYGAVLNNLKAQDDPTWRQVMGDSASRWYAYLTANPLPQGQSLEQYFANWAYSHMDPGTAQAAVAAYNQSLNASINSALTMYDQAGNGPFAYTVTIKNLRDRVSQGSPMSFSVDSSRSSSDVSKTWASGEISGGGGLFAGAATGSHQALSTLLASSSVQITASFKRVATLSARPLSQPSSDPDLGDKKPWFSAAALMLALGTKDNTVWKSSSPPSWESTFGPNGNLKRLTTSIVAVDGIDIGIVSNTPLSATDQQMVQAASSTGLWPFFGVGASSAHTQSTNFTADGRVHSQVSVALGNPQVLGVVVTPIEQFLNGAGGAG